MKRYPNIYRVKWTPNWVFRKFSAQKGKQFEKSTEVPATDRNMGDAYRKGLNMFNEWLGHHLPSGREILVKDIARAVLTTKKGKDSEPTIRIAIDKHIIPEFGHLRPEQVTSLKWDHYDSIERRRVYTRHYGARTVTYRHTRMFNVRKMLLEILRRAHDEGLISRVPKLKNHDPKAAPPKYLDRQMIRKILHEASPAIKLLTFIMWKQGARPREVLKYRYSMIRFSEGETGKIYIPAEITKTKRPRAIPLNSRVSRVLKRKKMGSSDDFLFPSPRRPRVSQKEYKTGFRRAAERADVDATIYNFRDTFITDCLKRGLSSVFIGKYCDTSGLMIDRKYAVPVDEVMQKVAD